MLSRCASAQVSDEGIEVRPDLPRQSATDASIRYKTPADICMESRACSKPLVRGKHSSLGKKYLDLFHNTWNRSGLNDTPAVRETTRQFATPVEAVHRKSDHARDAEAEAWIVLPYV
jgi:hypothetical protein